MQPHTTRWRILVLGVIMAASAALVETIDGLKAPGQPFMLCTHSGGGVWVQPIPAERSTDAGPCHLDLNDDLRADGRASCYYRSEAVDGLNKICYYDCPRGRAAITIASHRLCPLRIEQ